MLAIAVQTKVQTSGLVQTNPRLFALEGKKVLFPKVNRIGGSIPPPASMRYAEEAARLSIAARFENLRKLLDTAKSPEYLNALPGTIGAQLLKLPTNQP